MLDQHGWISFIINPDRTFPGLQKLQAAIFIADIDDPACRGIELLRWFRKFNPITYSAALCKGGNSPAMRQARDCGVDGFFYLSRSGLGLDYDRGLANYFFKTHPQLTTNKHIKPHPIAA